MFLGEDQALLPDTLQHFGAKDLGQCLVIEQVRFSGFALAGGFGGLGTPKPLEPIDCGSGHYDVDMGVVSQGA